MRVSRLPWVLALSGSGAAAVRAAWLSLQRRDLLLELLDVLAVAAVVTADHRAQSSEGVSVPAASRDAGRRRSRPRPAPQAPGTGCAGLAAGAAPAAAAGTALLAGGCLETAGDAAGVGLRGRAVLEALNAAGDLVRRDPEGVHDIADGVDALVVGGDALRQLLDAAHLVEDLVHGAVHLLSERDAGRERRRSKSGNDVPDL